MRITNFTIGSDPELFIINTETDKVVSSIGLIPGEKGKPYHANDMPEGFGLEIDNILAEFNIPPVRTVESFINNIEYMKNYIRKFVKNVNPAYDIRCAASQIVDTDQLQSKEANEFGCSPDYNVYTDGPNKKPKVPTDGLRSAGVHVHLGYEHPDIDTSLKLIRYLDAYVGVPSVLQDGDTRRRSLYGKAGSFRLPEYGLEWRVLSSHFLQSPDTLRWVWNHIMRAIHAFNHHLAVPDARCIIKAIDQTDTVLAERLIKEYRLEGE